MRYGTLIGALLMTAAGIGLVACAAGPQKKPAPAAEDAATTSAAEPAAPMPSPYSGQVQDISILYAEIRSFRRDAGLPPDPSESNVIQFRRLPLSRAVDICPLEDQPTEGTCGEVCTLGDRICENAEDICRIAADMPGHTWAADKCSSAKASCKEAKEACCDCIEGAPAGGGAGSTEDSGGEPESRFWH